MNYQNLPENLPPPIDDGKADHLTGLSLPNVSLLSTSQTFINLQELQGITVIYIYPMTGKPGVALPQGWNEIPGARGCTPQSCSYRDNHKQFADQNIKVYGLSTQNTQYQQQVHQRLQLPYPLLSDKDFLLNKNLNLPTFNVEGMELYKRLTLILHGNKIIKVFYPVFPTDKNVQEVLLWLKQNLK